MIHLCFEQILKRDQPSREVKGADVSGSGTSKSAGTVRRPRAATASNGSLRLRFSGRASTPGCRRYVAREAVYPKSARPRQTPPRHREESCSRDCRGQPPDACRRFHEDRQHTRPAGASEPMVQIVFMRVRIASAVVQNQQRRTVRIAASPLRTAKPGSKCRSEVTSAAVTLAPFRGTVDSFRTRDPAESGGQRQAPRLGGRSVAPAASRFTRSHGRRLAKSRRHCR